MDAPFVSPSPAAPHTPKLLEQLHQRIRVLHYFTRTKQAYVDWAHRFILFHGNRHPREMGGAQVTAPLTHMAAERKLSAYARKQAKSAIMRP